MKVNSDETADKVAREIAVLRELDAQSLRKKWQELYGTKAPRCARPSHMVRAIAYKLQEKAFGGLKPLTSHRGRNRAAVEKLTNAPTTRRVSPFGGINLPLEMNS